MASSKNTPIAAGEKVSERSHLSQADKERLMDAVDQMFAEFELVYHNQFQKAFPDKEKLTYAKRLWLSHLSGFTAEQILAAARQATHDSEYLPTVRGVLKYLENRHALGLPEVRDAYREACLAPSPKAAQHWSHPAVYLAGAASDWYFLASTSEKIALPVFEKHYRDLCERVARGEKLQMPEVLALPEEIHEALSPQERHEHMLALRREAGL